MAKKPAPKPAGPQVRKFSDLVTTIGKGFQPMLNLIDQDVAANAQAGTAQEAGLAAQKETAFEQIGQRSQDKGMFFSGFSPDEEAKYTAGTYLPALAQLQATIAQTRSNLLGRKADINAEIYGTAFQTREKDVDRRFTWKENAADRKFQANESAKERQWKERQNQLDRDFQANQNAQDRAAAAARAAQDNSGPSANEVYDADRKAFASELFSVTGNDGYVSEGSYAAAKNNWVAMGYNPKSFDKTFKSYRNPDNNRYKLTK